jgi:cysteinyl-tRNA synthetase
VPQEPNAVGLYSCGPTVYQYAHLGNFRSFLLADTLRRVLEYQGLAVKHVMNITDVGHLVGDGDAGEDKVAQSAAAEGKTAWEIAAYYTDAFLEDLGRLHFLQPHVLPRATQHIPEQIALIEALEAKGYAYVTQDGVYFDTAKLPNYGALAGQDLEALAVGARVEVNAEKRNPTDFALWKRSPADAHRQMEWESPWGVGFPGWHIECSAMSVKYLGQPFDIHTGGEDHVFPHHTNEIAQTEAATGQPLAKYWLHGAFMMVDGRKMSKSLGNTFTVQDLIDHGHDPLAFRYLALTTHYRKPLNFTWDALRAAEQGVENLRGLVRALPAEAGSILEDDEAAFCSALGDDLNTAQALGVLWEVLRSDRADKVKAAAVSRWDRVLGLGLADELGRGSGSAEIPADIAALVADREAARQAGEYGRADELRTEIEARGFVVSDTSEGPQVAEQPRPTLL